MNEKSFAQIAETLRELGIEGLTDELVAETEAGYADMPADVEFGNTYTLEGENQDDRFDFEVANQLNRVIMEQGGTQKLYFASDGYQECMVFYCDDDWAKLFYEKTGLKLEI